MYISLVIPLFNEEDSLQELHDQISESFKNLGKNYEVLYIDDGSDDNSLNILKDLEEKNSEIKIFSLRKNMGKSQALMLGFSKAKGELVGTLDADLQDKPESIIEMISVLEKTNADMINGWRKKRKDSALKTRASRLFNTIMNKTFKTQVQDMNCPVKLFKKQILLDLQIYGGLHRFIPLLVSEMGYKVEEIEVPNNPRKYGVSKFGASKALTDIPDLFTMYFLTRYAGRPLHFFGKLGIIPFLTGTIILCYLTFLRIGGEKIGTRPLLTFGVLLVIFGIQIISTGLIADLIVNLSSRNNYTDPPLRYESDKK